MAGHQGIEEVAQSGQGLVLGGGGPGELVQELAGQAEGHLVELEPLVLAPGEEPTHLVGVGRPGGGGEIRARKNSSAAKQAAPCRRARGRPGRPREARFPPANLRF